MIYVLWEGDIGEWKRSHFYYVSVLEFLLLARAVILFASSYPVCLTVMLVVVSSRVEFISTSYDLGHDRSHWAWLRVTKGGPHAERQWAANFVTYRNVHEPVVSALCCARLHLPSPSPSLPLTLCKSVFLVAGPLVLVLYLLTFTDQEDLTEWLLTSVDLFYSYFIPRD